MDNEEESIIKWVNTFDLELPCSSLADLCDGVVMMTILSEISPDHFEVSRLTKSSGDNWVLKANNIKQVLRSLGDFYRNALMKHVDMSAVDPNAIAKSQSEDDLIDMLELIVGCAVLCEDKGRFIQAIFSLDHSAQAILKGMIERVMGRVSDASGKAYEETDEAEVSFTAKDASEDNLMLQEMVRSLQAEKLALLSNIDQLESQNRQFQDESKRLKQEMNRHDDEREALEGSDRTRAAAIANANRALQTELDETRRESERLAAELRIVKGDLSSTTMRLNVSEEGKARREIEAQQMADELDIAKDKASKLSRAEATIDKYQRKLEELSELKKQNKELEDKLDKSYDQVQELEASVRSMSSLNKLVEQYKDKAVEFEREKFEAMSALQMKNDELHRVLTDLESANEARRFVEEELASVKSELETDDVGPSSGGNAGLGLFESATALKEQNKRLERELKVAKHAAAEGGSGGSDLTKLQDDIALLTAELEDTKRAKKEREDLAFTLRRQLAELTAEYQKTAKALQESETSGGPINSAVAKEAEQQLSQRANTIRLLEEKLKEKETLINKLEQDKLKLETFAKKTVAGFKEKYMNVLHRITAEKKTLEGRLQAVILKNEKNQETHRREERLVLSAMYEIGVRIMDRNINAQVQESADFPATVLAQQRAEQDRKQFASVNAGGGAMNK